MAGVTDTHIQWIGNWCESVISLNVHMLVRWHPVFATVGVGVEFVQV